MCVCVCVYAYEVVLSTFVGNSFLFDMNGPDALVESQMTEYVSVHVCS